MRGVWWVGMVCGALLCGAPEVRAAIILGNLPPTNDLGNSNLSSGARKAVSFTMGPQDATLDSVNLRLDYNGGTPVLELRNDTGGADPGGSVLASFTTPGSLSGIQTYTFLPTGSYTLLAGQKYWLYAYGSAGTVQWKASSPSLTPSGSLATYGAYRGSSDGGLSWNASSTLNTFQLNGTLVPVPEPASLVLMGLGSVAAWGASRRRRRQSGPREPA